MFYKVNAKWMSEDKRPESDCLEYIPREEEVYLPNREQLLSYLVDLTGRMECPNNSEIIIKPYCFATHRYYKINDIYGKEVFPNET